MTQSKELYESFHQRSSSFRNIPSSEDYVHGKIIKFIGEVVASGKTVLDVGCGVGSVDLYFAEKGAKVLGIDISGRAIRIAKKSSQNSDLSSKVKFKTMRFPNEIPNQKFDTIICLEVLEHLENDLYSLKRLKSLLNNHGVLILSTPSENAPLYKLGLLKSFDNRVGHLRRYSANSLRTLFEAAGLRIIDLEKNEGIFRNFLFTNPIGGFFLKIIKRKPFSGIAELLDNLMLDLFGESDFFIKAIKK
jgi:2-polyprenyl-3-methyl-5-hydroxy-6-metoxy-1,4-benzoquinol methylase